MQHIFEVYLMYISADLDWGKRESVSESSSKAQALIGQAPSWYESDWPGRYVPTSVCMVHEATIWLCPFRKSHNACTSRDKSFNSKSTRCMLLLKLLIGGSSIVGLFWRVFLSFIPCSANGYRHWSLGEKLLYTKFSTKVEIQFQKVKAVFTIRHKLVSDWHDTTRTTHTCNQ